MRELKSGDVVNFTQEDGKRLVVIVYPNNICIKADVPGTDIKIDRGSSFTVKATAVDGR